MSGNSTIILVVIAIMLVVGVVSAMIWWHLADVMYPGTDAKTGQRIFKKRGRVANSQATVVKGFDSPGTPGDSKPGG